MSTTVEVYRVGSDNTTGEFLGFASLLDPTIAFLHPAAVAPPGSADPTSPDPIRPDPIGPNPITPDGPRPYRPDFPLQPRIARPVHDEPAPGAAEARARCRIRTDSSRLSIDGTILPTPIGVTVTPPTAIQLDVAFAGDFDVVAVPQGPGHPTADEAAAAVMAFLIDAAADDPAEPASPPPVGPDVDTHPPYPGRRPWYCVICPGAFGC